MPPLPASRSRHVNEALRWFLVYTWQLSYPMLFQFWTWQRLPKDLGHANDRRSVLGRSRSTMGRSTSSHKMIFSKITLDTEKLKIVTSHSEMNAKEHASNPTAIGRFADRWQASNCEDAKIRSDMGRPLLVCEFAISLSLLGSFRVVSFAEPEESAWGSESVKKISNK